MITISSIQRKNAFSLIELSIVLVILGLLTGGILAGKSLIRASELRSIGTQYSNYRTAVQAFRDKFFYLPGDIPNATAFWGTVSTNLTTCYNTTTNDARTCNGNGDGIVYYSNGNEIFRFWQHLANAGMIEGTYTGASGPANINYDSIIGTNIPGSSFPNVGWSIFSRATSGNSYIPDQTLANRFWVGTQGSPYWTQNAFLQSPELWNIDTKLDDGMPMTGIVRVIYFNYCTNAANSADTAATYVLAGAASNKIYCAMTFEKIF